MFKIVTLGHGHYCLFLDQQEELLLSNLSSNLKTTRKEILAGQIETLFKVMKANFDAEFAKPSREPG